MFTKRDEGECCHPGPWLACQSACSPRWWSTLCRLTTQSSRKEAALSLILKDPSFAGIFLLTQIIKEIIIFQSRYLKKKALFAVFTDYTKKYFRDTKVCYAGECKYTHLPYYHLKNDVNNIMIGRTRKRMGRETRNVKRMLLGDLLGNVHLDDWEGNLISINMDLRNIRLYKYYKKGRLLEHNQDIVQWSALLLVVLNLWILLLRFVSLTLIFNVSWVKSWGGKIKIYFILMLLNVMSHWYNLLGAFLKYVELLISTVFFIQLSVATSHHYLFDARHNELNYVFNKASLSHQN